MNKRPLGLVTGGMRRLGAHIAAGLARAGYDLALSSHAAGEMEAGVCDALAALGGEARHHVADLAAPGAPEALVAEVVADWGRAPDLLVNSAAMFGQDDWTSVDRTALDDHFALNLFAPVLLSRALVEAAGEGAQPAIVHIVDQRVANPNADQLAYTLSKQALAASIVTLAVQFRGRARVNGVAPGLILANPGFDADQMARVAATMPLGRNAGPDDIADAVLFLARAPSITGQLLFVDGGAHLEPHGRDFEHY